MRVTSKGQVTIPRHIRLKLNISPASEVEFIEESERIYLVKKKINNINKTRFKKLIGIASCQMTTDEIMQLTRDA